jgi:hypothetical protein
MDDGLRFKRLMDGVADAFIEYLEAKRDGYTEAQREFWAYQTVIDDLKKAK